VRGPGRIGRDRRRGERDRKGASIDQSAGDGTTAGFDVDSEPGSGTSVRVLLPCLDRVEDEAGVVATAAPRRSGRILLVDDQDVLVDILSRGLERFGHDVRALSTSASAYQVFTDEPDSFDVVVTDQTMPDMTGLELAVKLREIRADIPVVLISGLGAPTEDAAAIQRAGISEVLAKPFALDELGAAVARQLDTEPRP
jgi:CheY-like chemotaxis protein